MITKSFCYFANIVISPRLRFFSNKNWNRLILYYLGINFYRSCVISEKTSFSTFSLSHRDKINEKNDSSIEYPKIVWKLTSLKSIWYRWWSLFKSSTENFSELLTLADHLLDVLNFYIIKLAETPLFVFFFNFIHVVVQFPMCRTIFR